MFTGLVQYRGSLIALSRRSPMELTVRASLPASVLIGDSVAVNGACLTVIRIEESVYAFNLSEETLKMSHFADLVLGSPLNLELAMTLADRLGGHLVSGHLDGTARLKGIQKGSGSSRLSFLCGDRNWMKQMIPKGSIAVNGVSLTISELKGSEFRVDVIPHTLESTNLRDLRIGERVNIELDLLGKYLYNFYLTRERNGSK